MTIALLLSYIFLLVQWAILESNNRHCRITLEIDDDYQRKANHAALYKSAADWNEVMDARSLFWSAR